MNRILTRLLLLLLLLPNLALAQTGRDPGQWMTRDLVAWWRGFPGFTGGTALYDMGGNQTGNRYDGIFQSAPVWQGSTQPGVLEVAFNGTTDNIKVTGLLGTRPAITLSVYGRTTTNAFGQGWLDIGAYVGLWGSDDVHGFYYQGSSTWADITGGTGIANTGYHHFAYVCDPGNSRQELYLDGASLATGTQTIAIVYTGQGTDTYFSKNGNASSRFLQGGIIDARVYGRALSTTEVRDLGRVLRSGNALDPNRVPPGLTFAQLILGRFFPFFR